MDATTVTAAGPDTAAPQPERDLLLQRTLFSGPRRWVNDDLYSRIVRGVVRRTRAELHMDATDLRENAPIRAWLDHPTQSVDDDGLDDGAQLGGEGVQRGAEVAVLDGEQELVLGAAHARDEQRHGLRRDRGRRGPDPQSVDEPVDGDAPEPGADVTVGLVVGLVHRGLDAGPLQRHRRHRPACLGRQVSDVGGGDQRPHDRDRPPRPWRHRRRGTPRTAPYRCHCHRR